METFYNLIEMVSNLCSCYNQKNNDDLNEMDMREVQNKNNIFLHEKIAGKSPQDETKAQKVIRKQLNPGINTNWESEVNTYMKLKKGKKKTGMPLKHSLGNNVGNNM